MSTSETGTGKRVLLAGATGLVGRECLGLLLADKAFTHITAVVRRPLSVTASKERLSVEVLDFEGLGSRPSIFEVDTIICALGTTIREAGSKAAFKRVDYDYPLRIAQLGLAKGASHFVLVSSLGADPHSRFFYNRVKGEVERGLVKLRYRSLTVVRPSLLVGVRERRRMGEEIAKLAGYLTPPSYRPIAARSVAMVLVWSAREGRPGFQTIENSELHRLSRSMSG